MPINFEVTIQNDPVGKPRNKRRDVTVRTPEAIEDTSVSVDFTMNPGGFIDYRFVPPPIDSDDPPIELPADYIDYGTDTKVRGVPEYARDGLPFIHFDIGNFVYDYILNLSAPVTLSNDFVYDVMFSVDQIDTALTLDKSFDKGFSLITDNEVTLTQEQLRYQYGLNLEASTLLSNDFSVDVKVNAMATLLSLSGDQSFDYRYNLDASVGLVVEDLTLNQDANFETKVNDLSFANLISTNYGLGLDNINISLSKTQTFDHGIYFNLPNNMVTSPDFSE